MLFYRLLVVRTKKPAIPKLDFCDEVILQDHPLLISLQLFLEQQMPVHDPRAYLKEIKKILENKYYIGYGGTHIHIKSLDEKNEIAFITAGIL